MKKKSIFIIVFATLLSVIFTSCKPQYPPDGIGIGETCKIYSDSELLCTVTYNSCTMETIKAEEEILVIENITIEPQKAFRVKSEDFLLGVGFEAHFTNEDMRKTSISDNIRINGYDIFETELSKETNYSFSYIVPYANGNTKYYDIGMSLLVFDSYYLDYHF